MRVLLDECLPRRLSRLLQDHEVKTVAESGWAGTKNGSLLRRAEPHFDVFITVDRNLTFQQDTASYDLAIIVLVARSNAIENLEPLIPAILKALPQLKPHEIQRIGS